MNFDIKNFNNQRKNLKNINNKKNIYSKTDIFITVIEIFVMVPFILFNLPIKEEISGAIFGGFLGLSIFLYPALGGFRIKSFSHYFLSKYNKLKVKKLNIDNNLKREIINYRLFINNKDINEIINYYNSLNDVEKDFYCTNDTHQVYIYNFLEHYINNSDIEDIRENKEVIAEIISQEFDKYYLKGIKNVLQDRLDLEEEISKKQIINMFNDEKKEIKSVNSILKEI